MWLWLTKIQIKEKEKTEPSSYCSCVPDIYSAGMKLIISLIYAQVWVYSYIVLTTLTYIPLYTDTHTHLTNYVNIVNNV